MATKTNNNVSKAGKTPALQQNADHEVLIHFGVIFKSAKRHFHWLEKQTGVSGAQLSVLAVVSEKSGIRVNDIAEALHIHQSTASNLIVLLVKRGLVRRERGESDKRAVYIFLEANGKLLLKRSPKSLKGVLPEALGRLDKADLFELRRLLSILSGLIKGRLNSAKLIAE